MEAVVAATGLNEVQATALLEAAGGDPTLAVELFLDGALMTQTTAVAATVGPGEEISLHSNFSVLAVDDEAAFAEVLAMVRAAVPGLLDWVRARG